MEETSPEFDIVVYGATGYTGRFERRLRNGRNFEIHERKNAIQISSRDFI